MSHADRTPNQRDQPGAPGHGPPDVMTLVFTDLVGSVSIKRKLGNVRALALLDQHDALVRAVLREFPDGVEISTAGDSFFLAFHRPSDAVGFALRLQARLRDWNRSTPVRVADRIGIHAGEVAVERNVSGGIHDLKGIEVDKCARVMSLARAHQILLTGFAFENAHAFLAGLPLKEIGELSWASHGPYRLKGLDDPVEVFEVGETGHAPLVAPRGLGRNRVWGGAALTALLGLGFLILPPLWPVSHVSYDLGYLFRRVAPPAEVVLLFTDSESHELLGQPKGRAWDRTLHARLLDRLRAFDTRAVVFDVWFDGAEAMPPGADAALLEAVRRHGRVAVAGILQAGELEGSEVIQWKPPFPELAAATPWGVVHYDQAQGEIVRQPGKGSHEHRKDSLPREVVKMLGGEPPPTYREVWLNYYGPPGTLRSLPYWRVISNAVPASAFAGKIVFVGDRNDEGIGPTGGWRTDEAPTPYSHWLRRSAPGVEIVATTTLNLLRGDWLRRLSPEMETGIVVVAGIIAGAGLARLRPWAAIWVGLAGAAGVALTSLLLVWPTQVWFPWLIISGIQVPLALLWSWVAWRAPAPRVGVVLRTATGPAAAPKQVPASETISRSGQPVPPARRDVPDVPNYQLGRVIGSGAYGRVWLARDAVGLWRAVKVVRRDAFKDPRPYEREFDGIQRFTPISLEHPGLLRVLHVGRAPDDAYFFYVMELADPFGGARLRRASNTFDPDTYASHTLAAELEHRRNLPPAEVIQIGTALAEALHFLHQHQLVHRDVKPENVLFVAGNPKLADIGLVTTLAETEGGASNLGTFGYLAPEGPGAATADIFSLGRLLYVAATGSRPVDFPEFPADLDRRPDKALLLKLSEVWCRACEPFPAQRYDAAQAMAAALRALWAGLVAGGQGADRHTAGPETEPAGPLPPEGRGTG